MKACRLSFGFRCGIYLHRKIVDDTDLKSPRAWASSASKSPEAPPRTVEAEPQNSLVALRKGTAFPLIGRHSRIRVKSLQAQRPSGGPKLGHYRQQVTESQRADANAEEQIHRRRYRPSGESIGARLPQENRRDRENGEAIANTGHTA